MWGYIPPNVLGNLEKIPSSKANSTNAIYGIDGSPVVKDIYFDDTPNDGTTNPRWRTILLSGLGGGGKGLFALDVTNPIVQLIYLQLIMTKLIKLFNIGTLIDKKMSLVMQVEALIQNMIIEN